MTQLRHRTSIKRSGMYISGAAVAALVAIGAAAPGSAPAAPVVQPLRAARETPGPAQVEVAPIAPPAVRATVDEPANRLDRLASVATGLDRDVLRLALAARETAERQGRVKRSDVLTVVDYSRPSTEERMWVLDLEEEKLLYRELVAHGKNSGGNKTTSFSNVDGSNQSSVGLFVTADTYYGRNGYSLRLQGLEEGFNDNAIPRAIVVHGAPYVSKAIAESQGRLGRSLGCPAVSKEVSRPLIDTIKGGTPFFAYYPAERWLESSRYVASAQPA